MIDVLFLEDEAGMAEIVVESLKFEGFWVRHYLNGRDALESFKLFRPDIIILDIITPELNGFHLAKKIREMDDHVPIIFANARIQIKDVLKGFEIGASDYMKKPYSIKELIARMHSHLKKTNKVDSPKYSIGNYAFDSSMHELCINGVSTNLSYRESELLKKLVEHKNGVVTKTELLEELWEQNNFFTGRSLAVFISRLRKFLQQDPRIRILTVRNIGYILEIRDKR